MSRQSAQAVDFQREERELQGMTSSSGRSPEQDLPFRGGRDQDFLGTRVETHRFRRGKAPLPHQWKDTRRVRRQRKIAYRRVVGVAAATLLFTGALFGLAKGANKAANWASALGGSIGRGPAARAKSQNGGQCQPAPQPKGGELLVSMGVPFPATALIADKAKLESIALGLENKFALKGDYHFPASLDGVRVEPTSDGFNLISPNGTYSSLTGWKGDFTGLIEPAAAVASKSPYRGELAGVVLNSGWKLLTGLKLPEFVQSANLEHDSDQKKGRLEVHCQGPSWITISHKARAAQVGASKNRQNQSESLWGALPASSQRMLVPAALLGEFLPEQLGASNLSRLLRIHQDTLVGVGLEGPLMFGQSVGAIQRAARLDLPVSLVAPPDPVPSKVWGSQAAQDFDSSACKRLDFGELPPGPGKAASRSFGTTEHGWGSFLIQAAAERYVCDWSLTVGDAGFTIDYRYSSATSALEDPCIVCGPERESQHRTKPNLWANK